MIQKPVPDTLLQGWQLDWQLRMGRKTRKSKIFIPLSDMMCQWEVAPGQMFRKCETERIKTNERGRLNQLSNTPVIIIAP